MWTVPVRAGDDLFGHLVLAAAAPLPDADVRNVERAAQTAALLQLMERQVSAAEQQVRGELIDDLLAEREPDWDAFERRARRSGALDFRHPHTVLVLAATGLTRQHLLGRAATRAARHGGLATEHAGRVVVLLPRVDPTAAHAVARDLGRTTGAVVTAGIAGPGRGAPELRAHHREAERCLRLLLALGREGEAATLADLGVLGLVLRGTSPQQVRALLAEGVTPLQRYDEQHNTLLLETLNAYFAAGQNPRAAARALQVHPNTIYQRLDRIDQVLGHRRWREPEGALPVQLGLQLRQVLAHIPMEQLIPPASSRYPGDHHR
ncbi:hypothetical protein BJF90_01310 [Pseudonocardia sp. CNS-004]|nr:hypothetical protein BJF90_01310 [Pseudonocardia sp. CNS-004]